MPAKLWQALIDDLADLIRLHDRELDAATLAALKTVDFPASLALPLKNEAGLAATTLMQQVLKNIAEEPETAALDELAADYAGIYLTYSYGASPYESVWLDDDHLACQWPMFELRNLYAKANLSVVNWRQRPDDHLVCQLQYIAFQLQNTMNSQAFNPDELARFIDEHLGYWLPDFTTRVTHHCATLFYAALAQLTLAWLENFRLLLAEIYGQTPPSRAEITQIIQQKNARERTEIAPIHFVPGAGGPSW